MYVYVLCVCLRVFTKNNRSRRGCIFDCGNCPSRYQKRSMCDSGEDQTNERRETLFVWPHEWKVKAEQEKEQHKLEFPDWKYKLRPKRHKKDKKVYETTSDKNKAR